MSKICIKFSSHKSALYHGHTDFFVLPIGIGLIFFFFRDCNNFEVLWQCSLFFSEKYLEKRHWYGKKEVGSASKFCSKNFEGERRKTSSIPLVVNRKKTGKEIIYSCFELCRQSTGRDSEEAAIPI